MRKLLLQLGFYGAILGTWVLLHHWRVWPDYVLPAPQDVGLALWEGVQDGQYWNAIGKSLHRLLVGYAISVTLGLGLGIALARFRWLQDTLGSLLLGLQTLPSICWLPLALLWFGLNDRAIIFVIVVGSLLSITLATRTAIRQVPQLYVHAGRTLGASGSKLYLHVILPAAFPVVFEGLKQGWSFAWRSLMGGELLFVSMGIGHLLAMGRELNDMSQVIAVMTIIVGIGLATDRVFFGPVERTLARKWGFRKA